MPNMANITVKKADGTSVVTLTALNPSGGDKSLALWRDQASSTLSGAQTELTCTSKEAAGGTQRIVSWKMRLRYAVTDSTTGRIIVVKEAPASATFTVDKGVPDNIHAELAVQFAHVIASALGVQVNTTGFAPT